MGSSWPACQRLLTPFAAASSSLPSCSATPASKNTSNCVDHMTTELIRLEGINKSFGNVQALKDIALKIDSGEIVALLGDNGAGKSTLSKALSGVYPIDNGAIFFKGKHASIRSARDAIDLGIETIHQDSSLAPDLSIANNLFLGREPMRYAWMGAFS